MKQLLYILFCIVLCGICYGKPINSSIEKLPVDVQKHLDALLVAAKLNEWELVRKNYDRIEWQKVKKPAKILETISKELKKNKDCKELRKEVKTKYELLRQNDDVDLDDDVSVFTIPTIKVVVHKFPGIDLITIDIPKLILPSIHYLYLVDVNTIKINGLKYTYSDLMRLDPDVLKMLGIIIPIVDSQGISVIVVSIKDEKFISLMEFWEARYGKILDFYDDQGRKLVPARGTVLWLERNAVIKAVENGGDYDALWDRYNENFKKAIGRRINLKQKR